MQLVKTWPLLLICLVLAGCPGEDVQDPATEADFRLSLSETSLALTQGESTSVNVHVVPNGSFTGQVELQLVQPGTDKLSWTLEALGANAHTLKLTAPAELPPHTYTLYLKGASGSAKAAEELRVTVNASALITVTGTLRNLHARPISGAGVKLTSSSGQVLSTLSNASGSFALSPVLAPYNVTVSLPGGETHTFLGLTRPDPTFNLATTAGSTLTSVSIAGSVSGGAGFPSPLGVVTQVAYTSAKGNLGGASLPGGQGPDFLINTSQVNEPTAGGRLHALQWEAISTSTSSIPVRYTGYGVSGPFVSSGQTVSGKAVALSPISQSVLSGVIHPLEGMTVAFKLLGIHLSPGGGLLLAVDSSASPAFSYPVPVDPAFSGRYVLSVWAVASAGGTLILNQANLNTAETTPFALRSPPAVISPPQGSTGAVSSLRWTAGTLQSPLYILRYQPTSGADAYVYTTQASYPVSLKAATSYNWNVVAYSGFDTMDSFTAPTVWPSGYPAIAGDTDFQYGATRVHTFTTPP